MVQIVENWAEVEGRVVQVRPAAGLAGFSTVELDVEHVQPVEGFPNFFAGGGRIAVNVQQDALTAAGLREGRLARLRIRRGGLTSNFAHPDHVQALDKS